MIECSGSGSSRPGDDAFVVVVVFASFIFDWRESLRRRRGLTLVDLSKNHLEDEAAARMEIKGIRGSSQLRFFRCEFNLSERNFSDSLLVCSEDFFFVKI